MKGQKRGKIFLSLQWKLIIDFSFNVVVLFMYAHIYVNKPIPLTPKMLLCRLEQWFSTGGLRPTFGSWKLTFRSPKPDNGYGCVLGVTKIMFWYVDDQPEKVEYH